MNIQSLTRILVGVAWFAVVIAVVYVVFRASRNQDNKGGGRIIVGLIIVAILMTALSSGLVFIQPEDRGIVISAVAPKGYREQALEPGLRFIIPFAETVVVYPISRQNYTMSISPNEGAVQGDDLITARTLGRAGDLRSTPRSSTRSTRPRLSRCTSTGKTATRTNLVRPQARGIIRDIVSQIPGR